jgi:YidC/Oxa1 family membrane protein insertase
MERQPLIDEKQVLIAIVLCFVVIYGFQALFPPPRPTSKPVAPPTTAASPAPAPAAPADPNEKLPAVEAQPLVSAAEERDIIVEGPAFVAVFTTRGATLKSWRLKQYLDAAGEPLELVPTINPDTPRPFTLEFEDQATTDVLRRALFKPGADSLQISAVASATDSILTFEYRDASGLSARKGFKFSPASPYTLRFTADVTRNGTVLNPAVRWGPALGTGQVSGGMIYSPAPQPIFHRDSEVTRVAIKNIDQHRNEAGIFTFAGVDDHYFLSAVLPKKQPIRVQYEPVLVPASGQQAARQYISWSALFPEPPREVEYFLGPKDIDVLTSVGGPDLSRAIDFGMFGWLVVPLLQALKWVNQYIGNYGWSIVALTILINLAMFPLRHKSVVSMRKMQELQPEVKAIQDRYAKLKMNDPARSKMNTELMNLYRERGANPATGCIPMLLTLPVLFAFYAMLSVAIELRGAPFVGWIKDLAVHDPLFVTPLIMGITMFVQQKMTPSTADPVQQRMLMFMPIMFTVMLLWAPSGLVLYWTVSNLWGIGQQALTNRLIGPSPQHAVRPPAERRLKNVGAGKSPQAAKERK